MFALREPLGDVKRELFYYFYLLWRFFVFFSESIFPKNFIFCVLVEENQEAFSERCSLISGALQGLVKICKPFFIFAKSSTLDI